MSYTRTFTKNIQVYYSGSVSYPASQSGGSKSYSGYVTEQVTMSVTVDTDPFDEAIVDMHEQVDVLTGSVVATEAAQVLTIGENSRRIGDTIISGFFKTVKSDISQQIVELRTKADALIMQLRELAKRCNDKKRQMETDYQRIAARYTKIFDDLDHELDNRIHAIDQPVFEFRRKIDEIDSVPEKMVTTPTVTAGENARLHSMISASLAKRRAADLIEKGQRFLDIQYSTDNILSHCLRNGGENETIASPYCVLEAVSSPGISETSVFASPLLQSVSTEVLSSGLAAAGSRSADRDAAGVISEYFNSEIAEIRGSDTSSHAKRVADLTSRLFNQSEFAHKGN